MVCGYGGHMPELSGERLAGLALNLQQRIPGVTHACPDCDLGKPKPFCPTCYGIGTIDDAQIDQWLSKKNAAK